MSDAKTAGSCHSCSMTIDSGEFCEYCTNDGGELRSFEEIFERFVQFAMGRDSDLDRPSAEAQTREFMSVMPAWKGHPQLGSS